MSVFIYFRLPRNDLRKAGLTRGQWAGRNDEISKNKAERRFIIAIRILSRRMRFGNTSRSTLRPSGNFPLNTAYIFIHVIGLF